MKNLEAKFRLLNHTEAEARAVALRYGGARHSISATLFFASQTAN
jgi:hypothetical protein